MSTTTVANLGLVELGGDPIDIPGVKIHGYVYKFADKDPMSAELRAWWNIKKIAGYYQPQRQNTEVRIFVNYDSQECLAVAIKWLTIFREKFKSINILFPSGNVLQL